VNRTLFTVGLVEVREEVREAMSKPMITHRGDDYKRLQRGVVEKLHKVLETDMHILITPSSASGLLEACVRCGVKQKMMGISNGSFGERWQDIGTSNGREVKKVKVSWGKPVRPSDVSGQVDGSIEAVTIVANESSTGILNPVKQVVEEIRKEREPLFFVDGVTAVGGIDLGIRDLGIDALVFGSQKAFALPPGLAIACVSDRLLEKALQVPHRGYYFDLVQIKKSADKDFSLTTPAISLLYGLDYQLDRMLKEGMVNRYRRHQEMADLVRQWAAQHGGLYAEEEYRSNTITVINKAGLDFATFHKMLKAEGCEISNGYGEVKETTFRIGHMGDLTTAEIKDLLRIMDLVMEKMT